MVGGRERNGELGIEDKVKVEVKGEQERHIEFNIFCCNKDLDGSILQGVAFDEWVQYNANTKVRYSSTDNILPVLRQGIKN